MWDKLKLLSKIDESGGMGDIYLAYHKEFGATYAVKKLKNDLARTKDIKRFIREMSIIKNLTHPNIARLIDYSKDENNLGYAMEYCPDGSLDKYLTINPKTQDELMEIFWKLIDAINICHTNSPIIIHRDIKPKNILIGIDGEPKLSDFGLAISLDAEFERVTSSNWTSYGYSPPEQYKSFKDCDCQSDIYSIGATLYTMLTNKYYENEENLKDFKDQKIKHLLMGMLKFNKEERFKSVGQIKNTWEILNKRVAIREFFTLEKNTKLAKLDTYLNYYCGMEDDFMMINQAATFLQAIIETEIDKDVVIRSKEIFKHIDEQGTILESELDQANPKM